MVRVWAGLGDRQSTHRADMTQHGVAVLPMADLDGVDGHRRSPPSPSAAASVVAHTGGARRALRAVGSGLRRERRLYEIHTHTHVALGDPAPPPAREALIRLLLGEAHFALVCQSGRSHAGKAERRCTRVYLPLTSLIHTHV